MRQIILDTETTGLEPAQGHRLVELAAVELVNRRRSGNRFQRYLNPERASDVAAIHIHGLADDFLLDKPKFRDIAREFLDFISGAELIIHNAPFDLAFLNYELGLLGLGTIPDYCPSVLDTLILAKDLYPGKKANIDALCERYQVDHSRRTLHGALLDAELLGEVYLAMTRGQESLVIDLAPLAAQTDRLRAARPGQLLIVRASEAELAQHDEILKSLARESKRGNCVWQTIVADVPPAANSQNA